jgi:hypothetical protein
MQMLIRKYPEQVSLPGPMPSQEVRMFRVTPTVISVLDYSKGFGHTDLVHVHDSREEAADIVEGANLESFPASGPPRMDTNDREIVEDLNVFKYAFVLGTTILALANGSVTF